MKLNIKHTSVSLLLAAMALPCLVGCQDDEKTKFFDEFSTIVYFRDSGEQTLTLYKTGENTHTTVTVTKAGSDVSTSTSVQVATMNDAELQAYNSEWNTNYRALPSTCYEFNDGQTVQLTEAQSYQIIDISLIPENIETYVDLSETYVLGLVLYNCADSINADKNYVFINPTEVVTPYIEFSISDDSGITSAYEIDDTKATTTAKISFNMPSDNLWNFEPIIEIDNSLITAYNAENGTSIEVLPTDAYTISASSFVSGSNSGSLTITVDNTKVDYGQYGVPIRLTGTTSESVTVNGSVELIVAFNLILPEISLTTANIYNSYGFIDWDGDGIPALVDGDPSTYCHGDWSVPTGDITYGQYFDVKIDEAIQKTSIGFYTRATNGNGVPTIIDIYVGNDGSNWTKLKRIATGLSSSDIAYKYVSDVFVADEAFTYMRVACVKSVAGDLTTCELMNNALWCCYGEFMLYGK